MPRSPSATPRCPTPRSILRPPSRRPTRATMESPSPARPESSLGPPSCRTPMTEAWTPGQALRSDGLNPPRPPSLGGRLRESGIQAAETIIAGGAAGAAAAARSVGENGTFNMLNRGGDWLDRTLRIPRRPPGLGPPPDEVPPPQIIGRPSEVEPLLERAGQRAAEVERSAAHRAVRRPARGGGGGLGRLRNGCRSCGGRSRSGNSSGSGRRCFGAAG